MQDTPRESYLCYSGPRLADACVLQACVVHLKICAPMYVLSLVTCLLQSQVTMASVILQDDYLDCMKQRMHGILSEADQIVAFIAAPTPEGAAPYRTLVVLHEVESLDPLTFVMYLSRMMWISASMFQWMLLLAGVASLQESGGWGVVEDEHTWLTRFVVELDQRFLTELAHTAASFVELFEQNGRTRLLQVNCVLN